MEEKRECYKRETEAVDEKIYRVLFTAGAALLMACLKRAIMMTLIEQWRLWVFLLLNLVLLAIFFTSMHPTSGEQGQEADGHESVNVKGEKMKRKKEQYGWENQESTDSVKVKTERMGRRKQCMQLGSVQAEANNNNKIHEERRNESEQQSIEDDSEAPRLSKEELNERVEAFIATFRQHLLSDARKCREQTFSRRKQTENFIKV